MNTPRSIKSFLTINTLVAAFCVTQGYGADTNAVPTKTTGAQPVTEAASGVTTNSAAAPSAMRTQLTPEFGQRLRAVGYKASDLDLTTTESRLKPEFTGPFPNIVRGNFAKLMDSINPFGHDVPTQVRPNSFLIMGNVPPVAGWRNEISHEPVGISVIGFGR